MEFFLIFAIAFGLFFLFKYCAIIYKYDQTLELLDKYHSLLNKTLDYNYDLIQDKPSESKYAKYDSLCEEYVSITKDPYT